MNSTENHQIEAVLEGLLEKDNQAKRHKILIRDIQQEALKEMPLKLPHENSKKAPKITKKGKIGRTQSSLEEPRRIIYTYHEGSYKV
jgi:hypothetical protein